MKLSMSDVSMSWKAINSPGVVLRICLLGTLLLQAELVSAETLSAETLYQQNCAACHAADGSGSRRGVPDLTTRRQWKEASMKAVVKRMMRGSMSTNGRMAMPPRGGNPDLSEADMQQILEYMRNTF